MRLATAATNALFPEETRATPCAGLFFAYRTARGMLSQRGFDRCLQPPPFPMSSTPDPGEPVASDSTSFQRRESAARDALRALIRDFIRQEAGHRIARDAAVELDLHLKLRPGAHDGWELDFDPPLDRQLQDQCQELLSRTKVYQQGRIYCFRCHRSSCEHSTGTSPLMVFKAYSATGVPEWQEFSQALIDSRDERVDQLFDRARAVVAQVKRGRELRGQQLGSFGRSSKTYAPLGQVTAGYFFLDNVNRNHQGLDTRVAVTFQVVETRRENGQAALALNAVSALPGGCAFEELLASDWEPWLARAYRRTAFEVAKIEKQYIAARMERDNKAIGRALGRVPGVLQRLATSLQRGSRQSRRRTQHAEQRREQRRTVQMAMADSRTAKPQDFFYDERSDTIVVRGDHGRLHVFTPHGRHVTSFRGQPQFIDLRIRARRWRRLEDIERVPFEKQLHGSGSAPA